MRQGDGVHYIGIDLAWGDKQPTGLAVLDDDARLLHVSAVRTDDEIEAALAAYVDGRLPRRDRRPDRGHECHRVAARPSNSSAGTSVATTQAPTRPTPASPSSPTAPGPRRCAKRLGLDIDPRSGRRRRAIEVYPHPATIVLFGLPKILRYKAKPGRDLDLLRSELLALMTSRGRRRSRPSETWAGLRDQVENATRKSELRRVEDQVDAVLCAYLAHFADHRPELVTRYGDLETGYIVTPTLGAEVGPPRVDVVARCGAGVRRASTASSTAGRAGGGRPGAGAARRGRHQLPVASPGAPRASRRSPRRRPARDGGRPLYTDPLREISDQLGVRVITYVRDDVDAVADAAGRPGGRPRRPRPGPRDRERGPVRLRQPPPADRPRRGARGPAGVRPPARAQRRRSRSGPCCSTPGRSSSTTSATRARCPPSTPATSTGASPSPPGCSSWPTRSSPRSATGCAAAPRRATRAGDRTTTRGSTPASWRRSSPGSTPTPGGRAPTTTTGSPACSSSSASPRSTSSATSLRAADEAAISERMDYRYPPGAVRRLDDALLATYGERYVGLHGNAHRAGLLEHRLQRLRGEPSPRGPGEPRSDP